MGPVTSAIDAPTRGAGRGAYGLRITGISADDMLVPADRLWPHLRVAVTIAATDSALTEEAVTEERADLRLRTGGRLEVHRATGLARFVVPRRLTDDEVVHPFLAPAAAVMAHWLNRPCFHSGGFVSAGGVWGLVGDRESGKSTTLAWLALQGHSIVADDILVLDPEGRAYAGPRSIDLRRGTAEHLGVGEALGRVGARSRWRMTLKPLNLELPFRGWFFLAWGERIEVVRLRGSESLARLLQQRTLRVRPTDPAAFLDLAALPAWEIRRPRDWALLEAASTCLIETSNSTSEMRP